MSEEKKGALREKMPAASALVDEMRQLFGQAWVDAALREGLRLQREHARLVAQTSQAAADAWLLSQRSGKPALAVVEGGAWIGALPGNKPAPLSTKRH